MGVKGGKKGEGKKSGSPKEEREGKKGVGKKK